MRVENRGTSLDSADLTLRVSIAVCEGVTELHGRFVASGNRGATGIRKNIEE